MSNHKVDEIPTQQGQSEVGYCKPQKETQFKPGQSGNPAGSPKARTNLYKHMSKYSGMIDAELAQLDLESLTQSEKAAPQDRPGYGSRQTHRGRRPGQVHH